MLVVISDLHFVDGTAGAHNVSADAFLEWLDDVVSLARNKQVKSLDILLLGDIFDLIRTEAWFSVPPEDRPWGDPDINEHPTELRPACRQKALQILSAIGEAAREQLGIITGTDPRAKDCIAKLESDLGIKVRRLFLPGNHDRLYNVDDAIRAQTRSLLDVFEGHVAELDPHIYRSTDYGVIARHGHEFDVWNFEGYRKDESQYVFDELAYQRVPIGDPITTELVVKLPRTVREKLRGAVREEVAEGVYERLQNIENVRPVTAAIPWIWHEAGVISDSAVAPGTGGGWEGEERQRVVDVVSEAASEVARSFMDLPFVKRWVEEHDRWGFDEADELQALSALLKLGVNIRELSGLMKTYDGFQRFASGHTDSQRKAALCEPGLQLPDYHYVIYGHTHQFEQAALKVVDGHEKVYLNSGTWRPRFFLADNRADFVQWKEMTYLVFFRPDEDCDGFDFKGHSLLTWTGTMLKRRRQKPI